MPRKSIGWLGSGLPGWLIGVIVAVSSVVFVMVGGALWSVPREATHIGRILVSYGIVVPFAAAALFAKKRFSSVHLVTTSLLAWSIKLVVTATLYMLIAPGPVSRYAPAAVNESVHERTVEAARYASAPREFSAGGISGRVMKNGEPVANAIVMIDVPAPGRARADKAEQPVRIGAAGFDKALYLAATQDVLVVENTDANLHTLHIHRGDKVFKNTPLPASGDPTTIKVPARGIYEIRCDNHESETANLIVVDHPYATRTGVSARFALPNVPTGDVTLIAFADAQHSSRRQIRVDAEQTTELEIEVANQ